MRESLGAKETKGQGLMISLLMRMDYHRSTVSNMLIIELKLENSLKRSRGLGCTRDVTFRGPKLPQNSSLSPSGCLESLGLRGVKQLQ